MVKLTRACLLLQNVQAGRDPKDRIAPTVVLRMENRIPEMMSDLHEILQHEG